MASTIQVTMTQTGFSNASKTYTFGADQDATDMVAAYQSDANVSVNGTATRSQVLLYIFQNVLVDAIKAKVKAYRVVPAVPGTEPTVT